MPSEPSSVSCRVKRGDFGTAHESSESLPFTHGPGPVRDSRTVGPAGAAQSERTDRVSPQGSRAETPAGSPGERVPAGTGRRIVPGPCRRTLLAPQLHLFTLLQTYLVGNEAPAMKRTM